MLLQSHLNEIHLLAAMPAAWKDGSVSGLRARGHYEVSITWKAHHLTRAVITSLSGGECKIRTAIPVKITGAQAKSVADANGYVNTFPSEAAKTYTVTPL